MATYLFGILGGYLLLQNKFFSENKLPIFRLAYSFSLLAAILVRAFDGPVIVQIAFASIAMSLLLMARMQVKKYAQVNLPKKNL